MGGFLLRVKLLTIPQNREVSATSFLPASWATSYTVGRQLADCLAVDRYGCGHPTHMRTVVMHRWTMMTGTMNPVMRSYMLVRRRRRSVPTEQTVANARPCGELLHFHVGADRVGSLDRSRRGDVSRAEADEAGENQCECHLFHKAIFLSFAVHLHLRHWLFYAPPVRRHLISFF